LRLHPSLSRTSSSAKGIAIFFSHNPTIFFFSHIPKHLTAFPASGLMPRPPALLFSTELGRLFSRAEPLQSFPERKQKMSPRSIRRAAEHKIQKAIRKSAFRQQNPPAPTAEPSPSSSVPPTRPPIQDQFPEPGAGPLPRFAEISQARLDANRQNAQKSRGAVTPAGRAASSQNRLSHGLARHNGKFALLATEDPADYAAFLDSLLEEHQPATPSEVTLVHSMSEAAWLRNRAQNLQPSCFDPATGQLVNEKSLALFIRYETSYSRSFNASLNQLLKLRAETRKAELGFEAQNRQTAAEERAEEKLQMKKDRHYWDVLLNDGKACHQLLINTDLRCKGAKQDPGFEAAFEAELGQRNLKTGSRSVLTAQAA
jgi:hypothetical protein